MTINQRSRGRLAGLLTLVSLAAQAQHINSADVQGGQLFINGGDFGVAAPPIVTLGALQLSVSSFSPTIIVAVVPGSVAPGSYILVVRSFRNLGEEAHLASLAVTIGAAGPPGPPGPQGATGPTGATGATGATGPQGLQGPAGTPGASGSPGAPGAPGQSVVGTPEPAGANCTYGGVKYVSSSGIAYVCNGAPGQQGPPGSLAGIDALRGTPCGIGPNVGTLAIDYGAPINEVVTLRCVPNATATLDVAFSSTVPGSAFIVQSFSSPPRSGPVPTTCGVGGSLQTHCVFTFDPGAPITLYGAANGFVVAALHWQDSAGVALPGCPPNNVVPLDTLFTHCTVTLGAGGSVTRMEVALTSPF